VIGDMRRGAGAARRAARLEDDRLTLRRGNNAQWSFDLEIFSDMIDRTHFRRISDDSGLSIPDERVWLDAGPQCPADIDKTPRADHNGRYDPAIRQNRN
jgi:hypothetical protein